MKVLLLGSTHLIGVFQSVACPTSDTRCNFRWCPENITFIPYQVFHVGSLPTMLVIMLRRTSHPENGMSSLSPPPTGFPISQRLIEHHTQHPGWKSESRNGHSFVPVGTGGYNEHRKEQMMIRSCSGWSGGGHRSRGPGSETVHNLWFFLLGHMWCLGFFSWDAHTSAFQTGRRWARSLFFLKSFFSTLESFFFSFFFWLVSFFVSLLCICWEVAPLTSLSADWEWDVRSSVRNWDWLTGKEEESLFVGKE